MFTFEFYEFVTISCSYLVSTCQGFLKMKTKDFTERFLSTYKVNLDNLDIYTKNLALLVRYSCNIMVFIIVPFSEHSHKLLKAETTHTRNLGNGFLLYFMRTHLPMTLMTLPPMTNYFTMTPLHLLWNLL